MKKEAIISSCGTYRYSLARVWDETGPNCLFIMLNPSTADAEQDDATIRRCISFAREWGCGRLTVGNRFAYRSKDPSELLRVRDPVGPENDEWLQRMRAAADIICIAWGGHIVRVKSIKLPFDFSGVLCLGVTKRGQPRHPLYVKADMRPVPFASFSGDSQKKM